MCAPQVGSATFIYIESSGNSHGYLQRLREEFEQQTSKLARRDITKAGTRCDKRAGFLRRIGSLA